MCTFADVAFLLGSSSTHSISLSQRCFISILLLESGIIKSEGGASSTGTVEGVAGTLSSVTREPRAAASDIGADFEWCSGVIRAAQSGNSGPRPGGGSVLSGVELVTMVRLFVFC